VLYSRLDEGQLRSELSRIFRIRPQDEPPRPTSESPPEAHEPDITPKVAG